MSRRPVRASLAFALATVAFVASIVTAVHPARAQGDANWSNLFGLPGTDAEVLCAATWNGNLVVGGSFGWAGTTPSPNVAMWNGTTWSALGSSFDNRVEALAVWNGSLYAAGVFGASGTTTLNALARWNGSAWVDVGGGPNGEADALLATPSGLVVGGSFTDGPQFSGAGNVATWNGTSWSAMNGGVNGAVHGLALHGGHVAAVGDFGGHVAIFDGASWNTVGGGFADGDNPPVLDAVASHGGQLYVGGSFDVTPGSEELLNIGRWDGSAWHAVGGGADGEVRALAEWNGNLYLGGMFLNPVIHFAAWDGSNFTSPGDVFGVGMYGGDYVNTIAPGTSKLYVAGMLNEVWPSSAAPLFGSNVFSFDGAAYGELGAENGLDDQGYSITRWNGSIVVGGAFVHGYAAGALRGVARWTGSQWTPLGDGLQSSGSLYLRVDGLATFGTELVACGQFATSGPTTVNNIAHWNGASWAPYGNGFASELQAVMVYNGELWAAGGYQELAHNTSGQLWKWNGSAWVAQAGDVTGMTFAQWNGRLILGGYFTTVAGVPANCVAQWDGSHWSALGAGFDGTVLSLAVYNGDLYAAGEFYHSGANAVAGIARWNGSQWVAVGGSVVTNWSAFGLAAGAGYLWAGGAWDHIGSTTGLNNVARWDGSSWAPLGSGANGPVRALYVDGTDVWAVGMFSEAGNQLALRVSKWSTSTTDVEAPNVPLAFAFAPPSPNPAAGPTRIDFTLPQRRDVQLVILDVSGRRVARLADGPFDPGRHSLVWNGASASGALVPAGVYWAVLTAGGQRLDHRLVRLR